MLSNQEEKKESLDINILYRRLTAGQYEVLRWYDKSTRANKRATEIISSKHKHARTQAHYSAI